MATIVVMGASIGGISQIYELQKEFGKGHRIVLVGDSDRFEFTPSNPWVAVGWRKPDQTTVELRKLMQKHGIEFYPEGVRRLHAADRHLELNDDKLIEYDYLVIATGPKLAFEEVPGLGPGRCRRHQEPHGIGVPRSPHPVDLQCQGYRGNRRTDSLHRIRCRRQGKETT